MGINRNTYIKALNEMVSAEEIVCLTGVRRSGKSTLLHQTIQSLIDAGTSPNNILYVNLDDPVFPRSIEGLGDILGKYGELKNPTGKIYVFFDEVQSIPNWESWLKSKYDQKENIKFFVTGSNSSLLSSNLSTLLTGRMLKLTVMPLSFNEFLKFNKVEFKDLDLDQSRLKYHLSSYLGEGGFPRPVLEKDKNMKQQLLREYYDGILLRDVLKGAKIKSPSKLIDLAQFAAANIGNLLSYNKIGGALGISDDSVKEYLRLLENSFLLSQVEFFSYSVKETVSIQKPRKNYLIDTGMRNAAGFRFSPDKGRLMENLVFLELKRRGHDVHYWKGQNEVDFVFRAGNKLQLVNVCYNLGKSKKRELNGLIEAMKKFRINNSMIITWSTEGQEKIGKKIINFVPLYKWLLE